MTNEISTGESIAHSKSELLTWMKGANRTFKWDALVAFDRATIEAVFREQYIRRYIGVQRYPLITGARNLLGSVYRAVDKVILGPPRVSFELSTVASDKPVVKVTLPIMGGYETKLSYEANGRVVIDRINFISILQSPTVTGVMNFKALQQVGEVGVIALDLKDGVYQLNIGKTDWEITEGGKIFSDAFKTWDAADTQWIVNRIRRNTGVMAVESFALRSQRKSTTAILGDADYEEGAVVAFVKMEGEYEAGGIPARESDMKYLIPDDLGDQYTATVIIKDIRVMLAFIKNVLMGTPHNRILEPSPFEATVIREADRGTLKITNALLFLGGYSTVVWGLPGYGSTRVVMYTYNINATIGTSRSAMSFSIEQPSAQNGQEAVMVITTQLVDAIMPVGIELKTQHQDTIVHNTQASATYISRYAMRLDGQSQSVKMHLVSSSTSGLSCKPYEFNSPYAQWSSVEANIISALERYGRLLTSQLNLSIVGVETFPLTGLLFSAPYRTKLIESASPQDIAMFGHVAPGLLNFTITTPFQAVAAGGTHDFAISDPAIGVIWSVKNLPGQSFPTGQISDTGRYTAPTLAQLTGPQKQVVVTARSGLTTASALVSVVRRGVELNPLVACVQAGKSEGSTVTVGKISSATAVWASVAPEDGRLEPVAGQPNAREFVPPSSPIPDVLLKVVTLSATVDGVTERAYMVVQHNAIAAVGILAAEFNPANRTAQLSAPDFSDVNWQWEVVAGSATIDNAGVLRADANPELPFVVVTAIWAPLPNIPPYWGYILLPLPLAPYPEKPTVNSHSPVLLGQPSSQPFGAI
jgi:hypothetical protein